jgi:hypothetical protein
MKDRIEGTLDMNIVRYVVLDEGETIIPGERSNVFHIPGEEVVHRDHFPTSLQEQPAQV